MCAKTAWIPQKHPPATTVVCLPLAVAFCASTAGLGTASLAPPARQASATASTVAIIANIRTESLDITVLLTPDHSDPQSIRVTSSVEVSDVPDTQVAVIKMSPGRQGMP